MLENERPIFFRKFFTPQPDITAHELAVIIFNIIDREINIRTKDWEEMEPQLKRHFRDEP